MAKQIEEIILKVSTDTRGVDLGLSKIQKKIAPTEKGIKNLQKSVKGMNTEVKKANKETGLLSSSMGKLASGAAAGLVIAKLKEMGKEAINVSRDFERIGLSMSTVFGGDAANQMAFIEAEANRLGVSVRESSKGFAQLAAATKSTLSIKQTQELFTATAEAASALGLDAQKTGRLLKALSQIASKGTLSAEELRQQMGEHLPGAFDLAAKSMGITTQQLNKMLEQGEIAAKDFLPGFAEELRRTFHEGAMNNANSEIAQSTRNLNLWEKQLKLSGDTLKSITTPATGALLTKWDQLTDAISDGILSFTHTAEEVREMSNSLDQASLANDKFVESEKKVTSAADMAAHALKSALEIINKFQREAFKTSETDKLRISLGLTEKGFSKIAGVVKALGDKGLDANDSMTQLRETIEQLQDLGQLKEGDFIKSEDVKNAEKIQKSFEKWIGDQFVMPEGFETFGKVLTGEAAKPQDLSGARTPQEGLELGTAEAAKFLIRPVKEENKIQKDMLAEEKKTAVNTAKIAENPLIMKQAKF